MTVHTLSEDMAPQLAQTQHGVLSPLRRQLNRLFDEIAEGASLVSNLAAIPSVDVIDRAESVEVSVELPGMTRNEVEVRVDGDRLTISGEKKTGRETKTAAYRVFERGFGKFARTLHLPHAVDTAQIKAVMADGVLTVTAPKRPDAARQPIDIAVA